ncbi:MAG TPA: sigma-54 dependent transcriptional regulator [bacterium]|nr:sigma-54 dependent transcriptional regulator [bacterium]
MSQPNRVNVLIVDDEESLTSALEKLLRRDQRTFAAVASAGEALEFAAKNRVDVALVDVNLPDRSGIEVLERLRAGGSDTEVILMTGKGTVETAVSALKKGAYDYLTKPFDDIERVSLVVGKAIEKTDLLRKIRELEVSGTEEDRFLDIVGKSLKMHEVYQLIDRVAPSNSSVLILGESGTGKELVARAIHQKSRRKDNPFVVINCAALPETLLESELFGYRKGAFTGAFADKKGLFEEADGGTIFLDEIGEITPAVQVKLLRVLQNGEIRRIGGSENSRVDVRVLAATNKDLHQQVKTKAFREDLFYRLNVITLTLPPLRERKDDVSLLAYHFLKKFSEKTGKNVERISMDTLQTLEEYRWPGNVRELENVIERAVVLAEGGTITARELPPKLLGEFFYLPETRSETDFIHLPYRSAKQKALNLFNRAYISNLLRQTSGNVSLASERAGMDRSNFKKIIKKCEINIREFKKRETA